MTLPAPTDAQIAQAKIDAQAGNMLKLSCPMGHGMLCVAPNHPDRANVILKACCPKCDRRLVQVS